MFNRNVRRKAQSMVEYAVAIAAVAAALASVGVLFQGGLQKRIRELALELDGKAYAPRMTTSSSTANTTSTINETYSGGITQTNYSDTTTRSGNETVLPETWP